MGIFHLVMFGLASSGKMPLVPALFVGGFLLFMDAALYQRLFGPYARKVLSLRRFGRMRLHLPQIPLALGSQCQVELEANKSLGKLERVSVTLRRVREYGSGQNQDTRHEETYEDSWDVDAAPLREGHNLPILLVLPPVEQQGPTVLSSPPRTYGSWSSNPRSPAWTWTPGSCSPCT